MRSSYYVPATSPWPVCMVVVLGAFMLAMAVSLTYGRGEPLMLAGLVGILTVMFVWFRDVVRESRQGLYDAQMDRSFRQGMAWFIFSEIMFFLAFFGALFYVRVFAIPWLDGEGAKGISALLWPDFSGSWPLMNPPDTAISGPQEIIDPWHLPLLNTALLITSSITLTIAHHALKQQKRTQTTNWLVLTVLLGVVFLIVQGIEYIEAYQQLGLTLEAGIYGATFFVLTGFHGLHVCVGTIILAVMLWRILLGHFSADNHFGFEAAAWYWHFVDVVWLGLFIFVYVI